MKEIKTFFRAQKASAEIDALEKQGTTGITLTDAMGMGKMIDSRKTQYSIQIAERFLKISRLEIVCADCNVHNLLKIIREKAFTGMKDDGIIYVSEVEMAIKIRTGEIGEEGLQ